MFTTRRYRRRAAGGLLLVCLGIAAGAVPAYQRGWIATLPNWVIAAFADATASPGKSSLRDEAWKRIAESTMQGWTARWYITRCAGGDSQQWLRLPDAWPLNHSVPILAQGPASLRDNPLIDLVVRVPAVSAEWVRLDRFSSTPDILPGIREPANQLKLELRLVRSSLNGPVAWMAKPGLAPNAGELLYSTAVMVPIEVRGTRSDFLDTIATAESSRRVEDALCPRLVRMANGKVLFAINDTPFNGWGGIDFGIRLHADICVKDEVVCTARTGPIWGRSGRTNTEWRKWHNIEVSWLPRGVEALNEALERDPASVRIVLLGDPAAACAEYLLNPFDKPRPACWTGAIDIPARRMPPGPVTRETETPR